MRIRIWRRYMTGVLALLFWLPGNSIRAEEFMLVHEIRAGMQGYAKTVVQGDDIVTFDVRVLGVMKDRGPSGDLILAKFSGEVMDETGGIVHGMSGSPVYIDGKLVGAVAYGWGFADGTIGMITPIEDMVKLWDLPIGYRDIDPWKGERLLPIGTPLMAYGFDRASLDYMKEKMPDIALEAYDTAASDGDDAAKPLEAGGSVAALLVDGDLKLGAIGTVTYVDGANVVAFGHPFLKRGSMAYFMHNANIFTVVKSVNSGFKLGSMGAEVGTVTEDRGAGIAGREGKYSAGIPVRIFVRDDDTEHERRAFVKTVEDEKLTPALAATALYNFINKTSDRSGEGTSEIALTITPRNPEYKPLTRTNMFYSSTSISEKSVDEFYNILDVLMNNSFIDFEISDIKVDAKVTSERLTARIEDAAAAPAVASPGDTVTVRVDLRPFRGDIVTKELLYVIPEHMPYGPLTLEVRGGGVTPLPYLIEKQRYNLTDEILRRLRHYKDFEDFYKKLNDTDTNRTIVVEALSEGVSMVDGEERADKKAKLESVERNPLPDSVRRADVDDATELLDDEDAYSVKAVTEYVVTGDGQLVINVVSPSQKAKALKAAEKDTER